MPGAHDKDRAPDFKAYLSSKEALWFWLSLAFIFAFFIFSFITSGNVLLLFIKRATALIFAFLIPGYVITRAIYPKEIDAIERFAFSVAFSVSFVMLVSYVLNYVWAITPFSLALTTFSLALAFAFIAALRGYRTRGRGQDSETEGGNTILPLLIIGTFAFVLNSYDLVLSPILGALDPYAWVGTVDYIVQNGHISLAEYVQFYAGYPPGFTFIATFLAVFLDIS
ncbi:MAG: DUF1616 domain-containing protein, partial [Candidatus Hydrothermarchaeaceae archaeon]